MKRSILAILIAAAALSVAPPAFAQTQAELKQAQGHFQKGAEWFAKGDYAKAVVEFMSGHSIAPNAMFLYNVSLSYERMGNLEEALSAAERAKQHDGMPDEVKVRNDARIEAFQIAMKSSEVGKAMESAVAQGGDEQDTKDGDVKGDEIEMVERPDGITTLGFAGLGLTAVGVGFGVAGFLTNGAINNDVADYEEAARAGDRDRYDSLRADIERKQTRGQIFYGVGAGAAALGLTLFVVDLVSGTEMVPANAWLMPTADGAMVGAQFSFR